MDKYHPVVLPFLGHVDFYPGADNQYGWSQPGCKEVLYSKWHSEIIDKYKKGSLES